MKPLIIFGAGGHSACVIGAAMESGLKADTVIDDHPTSGDVLGVPVFSTDEFRFPDSFRFIVAIGKPRNVARAKFDWLKSIGGEPLTVIHPRAYVSPFATVGAGSVVLAMSVIDPRVTVAENCIVNIGANIGHDSVIGHSAHVSANTIMGGNCHIGVEAWIGLGAAIREGTAVGDCSFVAMGAIISQDIPANKKAISPHKKEAVLLPI